MITRTLKVIEIKEFEGDYIVSKYYTEDGKYLAGYRAWSDFGDSCRNQNHLVELEQMYKELAIENGYLRKS